MDERTQYKYIGQGGKEYSAALNDVLVLRCHNERYHLAEVISIIFYGPPVFVVTVRCS